MAETSSLSSEEREALGASLVEIAEATSVEVALKLSEHLGGRHVQVPRTPSPQSPLVRVVGVRGCGRHLRAAGRRVDLHPDPAG